MPGIMTSWRQQYDRMLRSFERLTAMAEGRQWADSNHATDALFHFFQDAYQLRDWIAGDRTVASDPRPLFSNGKRRRNRPAGPVGPLAMQICEDVCKGVKHFREAWDTQVGGVIERQDVTVYPSVAGGRVRTASAADPVASGPGAPRHAWYIEAAGTTHHAVQVAQDVVVEWDQWLVQHGPTRPRTAAPAC
jgi:hypothetical protein